MYQPISCDYYDELTLFALQRNAVIVVYKNDNGNEERVEGIIRDVLTRDKEEFLILSNGQEIRLDKLISVNGKLVANYC